MSARIGVPTQAWFGMGALDPFLPLARERGWKTALVILSERMARRDFARDFIERIEADGMRARLFTEVCPNPRVKDVDHCVTTHRSSNPDVVIGIGGGSAMDQAKATALGLRVVGPVSAMLRGKVKLPASKAPLVLIPTTAGSGSEFSWAAILSDTERGVKTGLRGEVLAADYACVDPAATLSLPVDATMIAGFDVLTHALETFLSRKRSDYTAMHSRQAAQIVFAKLPLLKERPEDQQARSDMAFASMLMGINLALSSTCLPHRLQYPVGALTDCAHAESLAALYPAWLHATLPYATCDLAECASWLDPSVKSRDAAAAEWFVEEVNGLIQRIGLSRRLGEFGLAPPVVASLVEQVSGDLSNDPGDTSPSAIRKIFADSFGEN